jgi:regulatory protein
VSKITKLKKGSGRGKHVNVFLNGMFSFSLLDETAVKKALRVGQELSENEIKELQGDDRHQRCYNVAVRFLGYRPRSESEVRQRLQRHGFDSECREKAINRLKEQGLVDDNEFARFWIENRETFSPRSRKLTSLELRQKGLDSDTIERTVSEVNDSNSAYRAATSKASRLAARDYNDFRRRLGEHLVRRGFSYDVVKETVERAWKEQGRTANNICGHENE